jgi:hypothetical protein
MITGDSMQQPINPNDPLRWDIELLLRGTFYPVGFPVEITTNSYELLAAAEASWGRFAKSFSAPSIQIRLGVLPSASTVCPPAPSARGQQNLITLIADQENYVALDTREGFAFGWLSEAAVCDRAYLRYHFLEATVWILLDSLYLTSVHAACVALDGRGVLLCGDGGAGKSSLSYACARNGWTFLSDDSTKLIRRRQKRLVTGNPYQIRFRDSATELFPELGRQPVSARLSGELSIELATAEHPAIAVTTECAVDYLVFLNRHEPEPEGLFWFPKDRALQWLEQVVCYGEERVRDEHKAELRALVSAETLEMRYSSMDTALRLLEALVRKGPGVAHRHLTTARGSYDGSSSSFSS